MYQLDRAIQMAWRAPENNTFRGFISADFKVVDAPQGGYLTALCLSAAQRSLQAQEGRPHVELAPRTLNAHFLSVPTVSEFEARSTVMKHGRHITLISVTLSQGDRTFLRGTVTFAPTSERTSFQDRVAPRAVPPGRAQVLERRLPLHERYVMKRALGDDFGTSERAYTGGWLSFADGRPIDSIALATIWDAWPPAALVRRNGHRFRASMFTTEVSLYFRRQPLPPVRDNEVLMEVESLAALDGFMDERVSVWSPDGLLLAHSSQLLAQVASNGASA